MNAAAGLAPDEVVSRGVAKAGAAITTSTATSTNAATAA